MTVDENTSIVQGAHTYFKGSDDAWYIKSKETAFSSFYKYSDGTTVGSDGSTEKYFKVEPIIWRVLTENYDGKKLLLSERILTSTITYYPYWNVNRRIDDKDIFPNNYEYSSIRAYLNGLSFVDKPENDTEPAENKDYVGKGFLQTAFTGTQRQQIAKTKVVNDVTSTTDFTGEFPKADGQNQEYNCDFSCNDTNDKIFFLSQKEITTPEYGFAKYNEVDSARYRIPTDYAFAKKSNYCWWLRTPCYKYSSDVLNVYNGKSIGNYNDNQRDYVGSVPALCVK